MALLKRDSNSLPNTVIRANLTAMRTTIDLDDNAFKIAQSKSNTDGISLDQAVSALVLKGAGARAKKSTTPPGVFRSKGGRYTSADVAAALASD